MYDFTGIGNACLDLSAFIDEDSITRFSIDKGHQVVINDTTREELIKTLPSIEYTLGGSASNVAHVISSLGGKSTFMGRLANDDAGNTILKGLADAKIEYPMSAISNTDLKTAQIFCLITPDAERSFASYYGISNELSISDVDLETIQKSKLVYLDGYSLYSPHAKKAFDTIIDNTKDTNTLSIFHCGDVSVIKLFRDDALDLINKADVVIFNKEEALTAFPQNTLEGIVEQLSSSKKSGAVTMGGNGAYIFENGEILKINSPELKSPPIDTCGAGDHFSGGFLHGIINGFPLEKCGKLATLCAQDSLFHVGARPQSSLKEFLSQL